MITKRILLLMMLLYSLPAIASAQSFWLHRPLLGSRTIGVQGQIVALDSNEYLIADGVSDFEPLTTD
ncbi:MAG: hypothetical protein Q8922_16020 [Bacteroidota bacterium]|nr:hypothetical protein [Bacteroidota bacterium]